MPVPSPLHPLVGKPADIDSLTRGRCLEVICTACTFRGVITPREIELHYSLGAGQMFATRARSVWCPACDALTRAEPALHAPELRAELGRLEARQQKPSLLRKLGRWTGLGPRRTTNANTERQAALRAALAWLAVRQSPPRCLACGSTGVMDLKPDADRLTPHVCGGGLKLRPNGEFGSQGLQYRKRIMDLSIEGLVQGVRYTAR